MSFRFKDQTIPTGGGTDFTIDDTLTMSQENELSVTSPVQSILTQAEFDALPEAQQNKGFYVISDGGSGGGGGGGSGGGESAGEVYSTEEKRIGTWIDGKPLYRKVFQVTSPNGGEGAVVAPFSSDFCAVNFSGFLNTVTNANIPIGGIVGSGSCSAWTFSGNIWMQTTFGDYYNRPAYVVVEYTKTTDEGGTT